MSEITASNVQYTTHENTPGKEISLYQDALPVSQSYQLNLELPIVGTGKRNRNIGRKFYMEADILCSNTKMFAGMITSAPFY